jgi:hypothetical protein
MAFEPQIWTKTQKRFPNVEQKLFGTICQGNLKVSLKTHNCVI